MISPVATEKHSSERRILGEFLSDCTPHLLRPVLSWAEDEVVMPSGPFEGYDFDSGRLPYSRLLLNELGKWQRHVITGPTQSGKSFHAFVLVIMYYLFERQEDVIVGIPDDNMAGDKWLEDIKPVIEKSRYRNLLPKTGPGSKGAGKLKKIKFENGRFLRFMSAGGNDKQRAAATARVLIVTETDGMDVVAGTSQEGQTKIQQLEGRVRAFGDDALKFFECTVSTADAFTWDQYKSGTASRIAHQCRGCDAWVSPEREHLVGWQDAKDEIEAGELGRFSCPECGILYSEDDRVEMNNSALLVHKGQEVTPEGEIVGPVPRTHTLGFRWSGFQNLLFPTSMLAEEEWVAAHSEEPELADIARKQQAWAMPAENPNIEKTALTQEIVRGSDRRYAGRCNGSKRGEVPDGVDMLTAFIDCGKRELQWVVEAKVDRQIQVVDYGVFQTELPDIVGDEVAVERAIRDLTAEIEGQYPYLDCGLVDGNEWGDTVRPSVDSLPAVWNTSHGLPKYVHPTEANKAKEVPADGNENWHWSFVNGFWVVNFNPNKLKHLIHSGYLIKPLDTDGNRISGSVTLFGDNPNTHVDFSKEITAEEWVVEYKPGKGDVSRWNSVRRRNHWLDCSVGCKVGRLIVANERFSKEQDDMNPVSEIEIEIDPRLSRFAT